LAAECHGVVSSVPPELANQLLELRSSHAAFQADALAPSEICTKIKVWLI